MVTQLSVPAMVSAIKLALFIIGIGTYQFDLFSPSPLSVHKFFSDLSFISWRSLHWLRSGSISYLR